MDKNWIIVRWGFYLDKCCCCERIERFLVGWIGIIVKVIYNVVDICYLCFIVLKFNDREFYLKMVFWDVFYCWVGFFLCVW